MARKVGLQVFFTGSDELPFSKCKEARIRIEQVFDFVDFNPYCGEAFYAGSFEVDGERFLIHIFTKNDDAFFRVRARIELAYSRESLKFARLVTALQRIRSEYGPVAVRLGRFAGGRAYYTKSWTVMPSDEEMDGFIADAKGFIGSHIYGLRYFAKFLSEGIKP